MQPFKTLKTPQNTYIPTPIDGRRADIDGLRAIAVLAVIVFHLNTSWLPGGFIGVDIFFVISGFLITQKILQQQQSKRFSLLSFYAQRAKRIAPAVLVVVAATVMVAQLILLPHHAERVAESGLWSVFSLANVYFWQNLSSDYFSSGSSEIPLLHLWSLGVEEQFYLLWPLALLLIAGSVKRASTLIVLLAIAVASFVFAHSLFVIDRSFAYYMLPSRAGELLVGAIAAMAIPHARIQRHVKALAPAMALLGIGLIVGSLVFINESFVLPGFWAVPPTLGTALVILAGTQASTVVSRALGIRPLVWIGLISFSAYLWHWPLFAFYRYGYGEPDIAAALALFATTLLLAWFSYSAVEQPALRLKLPPVSALLRLFAAPSAAVATLSLGAMYADGYGLHFFSPSYQQSLRQAAATTTSALDYPEICQGWELSDDDVESGRCVIAAENKEDSHNKPSILLWGDSNAAHYIGIVGAQAAAAGQSLRNLAHASCPPIFADPSPYLNPRVAERAGQCQRSIDRVRDTLDDYQVVVLGASYAYYQDKDSRFAADFFLTAQQIADSNKQVVLLGKAPQFLDFRRDCAARSLRFPGMDCQPAARPIDPSIKAFNKRLAAFAAQHSNIRYFDANQYLCPNGLCSPFDANGQAIYFDQSHLDIRHSWALGKQIVNQEGQSTAFNAFYTNPAAAPAPVTAMSAK